MNWWDESEILSVGDRLVIERATADPELAEGVPSRELADARRRARDAVIAAVAPGIRIRHSPAGVEWSSDIDIDVECTTAMRSRLRNVGWIEVAPVLRRLGRSGGGRWAITADGEVVGAADLGLLDPRDPAAALARRTRSGIGIRQVIEARVLRRSGVPLYSHPEMARIAELERRLGGDELHPPNGLRAAWQRPSWLRRPRRRRRITVAISGIDGSGKSTLQDRFVRQLTLANIPYETHWQRPGHDIGWLGDLATRGKRILRLQREPGVRHASRTGSSRPASRRGFAGWIWIRIVVVDYLVRAVWFTTRSRGVVVSDRHGLDAIVTLATAYGLRHGFLVGLVGRLARGADVQMYLDIDPEAAHRRKPHDPIETSALAEQVAVYQRLLREVPDVEVVDAHQPVDVLCRKLWELLAARTTS